VAQFGARNAALLLLIHRMDRSKAFPVGLRGSPSERWNAQTLLRRLARRLSYIAKHAPRDGRPAPIDFGSFKVALHVGDQRIELGTSKLRFEP